MENPIDISDTYGVARLAPVYRMPNTVTKWWKSNRYMYQMDRYESKCRTVPQDDDTKVFKVFEKLLKCYSKSLEWFVDDGKKHDGERLAIYQMFAFAIGILLDKSKDRVAMINRMDNLISAQSNEQIVDEYSSTILLAARQYHKSPRSDQELFDLIKTIQDEYESRCLRWRVEGDEGINAYVKRLNQLYSNTVNDWIKETTVESELRKRITEYIDGSDQRILATYRQRMNSLKSEEATDETITKASEYDTDEKWIEMTKVHGRYVKLFEGNEDLLNLIKSEQKNIFVPKDNK